MSILNDFQRVGCDHPCPVCGKGDWCLTSRDDPGNPSRAICQRIESRHRFGEAGWLHRLRDDDWPRRGERKRTVRITSPLLESRSFAELADRCCTAVDPKRLAGFAESLGVSVTSMHRLRVGWLQESGAWTFPMTDSDGNVRGIRLRLRNGRKLAVKGGHDGLFIPSDLSVGGRLLIAEGPSDTAALLDLGFDAVGRPSCSGGIKLLSDRLTQLKMDEAVIVADSDQPGEQGAQNLASMLRIYVPVVKLITPPGGLKDAREWKQHGATTAEVEAVLEAAPVLRMPVRTTTRR